MTFGFRSLHIGPKIGIGIGGMTDVNPLSIAAGIFDSNGITKGTSNSANTNRILMYGVDTDFASVTLDEKIADTGAATPTDTPGGAFGTIFGPAPLRSHAASGVAQRFGTEITFGKQLYAISPNFGYVTVDAITSASLHLHWGPNVTFPTVGANFYTIWKTRLRALEASTGRIVRVIYCDLGANDSTDATAANAMQTNMGTMVTQLHADFPNAVIIWPLLSLATVTAFVATVRTKMLAYAATAPSYFFIPNVDYATMPDISHWDDPSCLTIGTQIAEAAREMLAIPAVSVTTSPNVVGFGVPKFGNSSPLLLDAYKGTQDQAYEVLFSHSGNLVATGMPAIADPATWTTLIDNTTTAGIINARWKVHGRKVPVGEIATDTVTNSHDRSPPQASIAITTGLENMAMRVTVLGPTGATLAVDVADSDQFNTNNTGPKTIKAVTTTAANEMILYIVGGMTFTANPTVTSFTAAGLTNVSRVIEFSTNMPDGDWGLISIWKGFKATAGSTGTASATFNVNVLAVDAVIAFKP